MQDEPNKIVSEMSITEQTVTGVSASTDPNVRYRAIIDASVEATLATAVKTGINGWHASVVHVEREHPAIPPASVVIIATEGSNIMLGPIAFPAEWVGPLRDTLNGLIEDQNRRALAALLQAPAEGGVQ